MMERLGQLGVNLNLIRWVESFLTERTQCVRENEVVSSQIMTTPQGSVISPVLFTLYTNECRSGDEGGGAWGEGNSVYFFICILSCPIVFCINVSDVL